MITLQRQPQWITESYVESPPAAVIVDRFGDMWQFGLRERSGYDLRRTRIERAGWEFEVMRNGKWTGEWAAKIACRAGEISIFGDYGKSRRKRWTGRDFV